MAVYKLQLKNKQFSILSTAWDKGKSIYKRLKGWLSKKPALIPKGPASDVVYNSTAAAAKNGAKAGGYADLAGQGGQAANKSGGYLRGTRAGAEVEAIRNRKQAAKNAAANKGGNANNANNIKSGNVKNNQQAKQNNNNNGSSSKKPAVYKVGNGKGITFNKVRSNNAPNMNGFTTTLSRNPYDLGGYSGFKYVIK